MKRTSKYPRDGMLFTPEQAKLIQAETQKRMRLQTSAMTAVEEQRVRRQATTNPRRLHASRPFISETPDGHEDRLETSRGTPCAGCPRGSVYRKFSRRIMSVFIASDCMYRIVLLSGETANPGLPLAGGFSKSNIGVIRWVGMSKKAIPGLVVVSR